MKRWMILLLALCLLVLTACGGRGGKQYDDTEPLTLDGDSSWLSNVKIRGGAVWLECELTLENHTAKPLTGCLTACLPDDVGKLVKEERLPGLLTSEVKPQVPTSLPDPAVLELEPGRTTLRITFIGCFAGDTEKHDRLLPELYWTAAGGGEETIIPKE
jgi:hypothetical protein